MWLNEHFRAALDRIVRWLVVDGPGMREFVRELHFLWHKHTYEFQMGDLLMGLRPFHVPHNIGFVLILNDRSMMYYQELGPIFPSGIPWMYLRREIDKYGSEFHVMHVAGHEVRLRSDDIVFFRPVARMSSTRG